MRLGARVGDSRPTYNGRHVVLTTRGKYVLAIVALLVALMLAAAVNADYGRCMARVNDVSVCGW